MNLITDPSAVIPGRHGAEGIGPLVEGTHGPRRALSFEGAPVNDGPGDGGEAARAALADHPAGGHPPGPPRRPGRDPGPAGTALPLGRGPGITGAIGGWSASGGD